MAELSEPDAETVLSALPALHRQLLEKQLDFLRTVHTQSGSTLSPRELAKKMAAVWFDVPAGGTRRQLTARVAAAGGSLVCELHAEAVRGGGASSPESALKATVRPLPVPSERAAGPVPPSP